MKKKVPEIGNRLYLLTLERQMSFPRNSNIMHEILNFGKISKNLQNSITKRNFKNNEENVWQIVSFFISLKLMVDYEDKLAIKLYETYIIVNSIRPICISIKYE